MDGSLGIPRLILLGCLLAIGLPGCRHFDMADPGGLWPFSREARTDTVPGLATPAERLTVLRNLAERASQAGPDEQARVSRELAHAIRQEADPSLRAEIVRALGNYPTDSAAATLRSALNDPEPEVRVAACEAWSRRGGPEAVQVLGAAVAGDIDLDVRLAAVKALGKTGDREATAALGGALADSDPAMERCVMLSLKEVTGEDFGGDARKWREYLDGQTPEREKSIWIVDRARDLWGLF